MLHALPRLPVRTLLFAPLLLAGLCLAGCTNYCTCCTWWRGETFDDDWNETGLRLCPTDPYGHEGLAGLWAGTWESRTSGDGGDVRAILTPYGANYYHAKFQSDAGGCCCSRSFETGVELRACLVNGVHQFSGHKGLIDPKSELRSYRGWANDRDFVVEYFSETDEGVIRLRRVPTTCGACFERGGIVGPGTPPLFVEPFCVETETPEDEALDADSSSPAEESP